MGDDKAIFQSLLSQIKFESAIALYQKKKTEAKPVQQRTSNDNDKWQPKSKDDIPKIYIASRT